MASSVTADVSPSQLVVFASALQHPLNDWTDRHVAQGFAWRPGGESFRTIAEAGTHEIEIDVTEHVDVLSPDSVGAIEVPFEVPTDGAIEVGSIADSVPLSLPSGPCLLRCEFLRPVDSAAERVRLVFARNDPPRFTIARADELLAMDGELLITAPAAIG